MKKDLKIFIADSDDYSTFVYKQLLLELGHKDVYTFDDSASCINSLVLMPDVIFLDYSIENNSGLEVLKQIKNIKPEIHVVVFSQIDEMNTAVNALKHGAYDLILKGDIEEEHIKMVLENIALLNREMTRKGRGVLQKVASLFW
ncbi:MAG: response regulator [Bacteroidia bacterium]